jgi:hypothetical protein
MSTDWQKLDVWKEGYRSGQSNADKVLREEVARLREALEDFRDHGMRTDTNPTGMFHDCGHFTLEVRTWQDYLESADAAVRERARQALAPADDKSTERGGGV